MTIRSRLKKLSGFDYKKKEAFWKDLFSKRTKISGNISSKTLENSFFPPKKKREKPSFSNK